MRRATFIFVALIAVAIALEPLIHTHPLSQTSNKPCAVCVGSVGSLSVLSPVPAAPVAIVSTLPTLVVAAIVPRAAIPLVSRAPPAA